MNAVEIADAVADLATEPFDAAEVPFTFLKALGLAETRIALIRMSDGLTAINAVKELMADIGRPRGDLYEVALWEDLVTVRGDEAFYAYMVDNQAIVIPETIDAIRAVAGREKDAGISISRTNVALGVTRFLPTTPPARNARVAAA